MCSIDLKDAYLSVPIAEHHRKFLRFIWQGVTYEFKCLPFGLSSAPRTFTKLLRPVMAFLRSQGMRTVIYLDDILVLAENKEDLVLQVHQVTTLLEQLGFTINIQKSSLEPAHLITYLGVVVDSVTMKFLLTEEKVQQISNICKQALAAQKVSAQDLASIVGKLVAARSAILPAPIHVRQLQFQLIQTLRASRSYRTQITLSKESQQELQWWIYKLHEWNGRDILPTPPNLLIQSDASLQGWGAVCKGTRTGGHWSAEERHQHINNLELQAGAFAVQTFTKGMGNIQVLLQMDNRSAVTYINKMGGTHSLTLSLQACNLWCWCLERNIHLSAEYLPGRENSTADQESRELESSAEWMLHKEVSADTGPMQDRPVCNQAEPPAAELYQLEARSVCSGDRCTPPRLEDVGGVHLSPILLDREMSTEDSPGEEHHNDSSAMVGLPSMVPSFTGESSRPPIASTQSQGSPVQPSRPYSPTSRPRTSTASRMQSIRGQYEAAGVSGRATELLLAGWSKKTNTVYQSGWSRWTSWCNKREVNPLSCGIQPFLDFLSDLFREGLKYRTINLIRSAVSMTHVPIESTPIGQHPLVSRLMKGVHNSRPPEPQYSTTWDVSIVLSWIKKLGKNEDLSLKDLSGKLALLMALVSANRTSELQALDLRFRVYTPEGVRFKLASLTKKRKAGAPVRECFYVSFTKDTCLCVVQCLKAYEEATKNHRHMRPDIPAPLFLSYIQPHKPVTSQRIAHWIKDSIKRAGVDTSTFKAHSVRGASASAAASGGLHITDVLKTADWSRESTFKQFYYRPVATAEKEFAHKVLNTLAE